ncbi:MAG: hypothetical protein IJF60_00005 [Agathobacter sp.]|nr:hypothetical protein [Agathobacter sp.]
MKKICIVFLIFIYTAGMVACGNQNVTQDTTSSSEDVEISTLQKDAKDWSEQEVVNMFYNMTNGEIGLEFLDCVVMPDYASNRIGAVLFEDTEDGTTNIAFFDAEGYAQQCGIYAKVADAPDLTYVGDGTVTFKLELDEYIIYNCNISILLDDGNVAFEISDDLQK